MAKKILMLGGRRSGKTTILASVLHSLRNETPGSICSFLDITPPSTNRNPKDTLLNKKREISNYITTLNASTLAAKSEIIVDLAATPDKSEYALRASINDTRPKVSIDMNFVDVPGEWMVQGTNDYETLKTDIKESDIIIIVVDTPYLMQNDDTLNEVFNRIDEITNAVGTLEIQNEYDEKLILFCPIKCEKWYFEDKIEEVSDKLQESYKILINSWVQNDAINMWILPIITAGGLEHTQLREGKLLFRDPTARSAGERCSLSTTGQLMFGDGRKENNQSNFSIQKDPSLTIDYTDIPLSWYKVNDKKFSPKYCEQPAFHILNFLINKEVGIVNAPSDNPIVIIWRRLQGLLFGARLPVFEKMLSELNKHKLIKYSGDGYRHITKPIE